MMITASSKLFTMLIASCMSEEATLALTTESTEARPERLYFYRPGGCGSEASFNPLTVMVNGAFDILRQPSYPDNPLAVDWRQGFSNVAYNLAHPAEAIEGSGGWRAFVAHEVFPYRGVSGGRVQFLPNYALHVLGEGMVNRKLAEWYEVHRFPAPAVWAVATSLTTLMLNEAAENGAYDGPNRDPVADMLFFNPLGWILFSLDPVAEFFSGPVRLSYWPGQAVLGLPSGNLINVGENYVLKIPLGDWVPVELFTSFSYRALFGVSVPVAEHGTISIGFGARMINLTASEAEEGRKIASDGRRNWELSVFWDIGDSLMASVDVGGFEDPLVRLNLYPGAVELFGAPVGAYLVAGRYDGFSVGLTVSAMPLIPSFSVAGDDALVAL